jgi:hypothetical protein
MANLKTIRWRELPSAISVKIWRRGQGAPLPDPSAAELQPMAAFTPEPVEQLIDTGGPVSHG